MNSPALAFAFEIRVKVSAPVDVGEVPGGRRRITRIEGGTFVGPGIKGRVVPGGDDWQLIRPDGVAEINARYTLETNAGQLITIRNVGLRHAPPEVMKKLLAGEAVDPALVYFRSIPAFETAAPELAGLMRSLFVAAAERHPSDVIIRVWRVT